MSAEGVALAEAEPQEVSHLFTSHVDALKVLRYAAPQRIVICNLLTTVEEGFDGVTRRKWALDNACAGKPGQRGMHRPNCFGMRSRHPVATSLHSSAFLS